MSTTPTPNDGGPAFPHLETRFGSDDFNGHKPGMSLRDWFAGQATDADIWLYLDQSRRIMPEDEKWNESLAKLGMCSIDLRSPPTITRAQARYAHADAMLADRAKTNHSP